MYPRCERDARDHVEALLHPLGPEWRIAWWSDDVQQHDDSYDEEQTDATDPDRVARERDHDALELQISKLREQQSLLRPMGPRFEAWICHPSAGSEPGSARLDVRPPKPRSQPVTYKAITDAVYALVGAVIVRNAHDGMTEVSRIA